MVEDLSNKSQNVVETGADVGLTNKDPTLKKINVGAGWDVKKMEGELPDLDICCFLLNKEFKTIEDDDFVFYNNTESREGAIKHHGDSLTGAGDGDDENILLDLNKIPYDITYIDFVLSVYEGEFKGLDLTMVKNVYLRVCNADSQEELVRYPLDAALKAKGKKCAAMIVAQLFRDGPKWRFVTKDECVQGGLAKVAQDRGIMIASG